jgi:hypothetical protein
MSATAAGGGGGPDGTYGLTRNNMTVHMPSDDMPTDYPEVSLAWLAGGGFDLKANNSQDKTPHACIYVWHKLAPPLGDVEFNFLATMVDNNPSPTTDGVFALFSPRARGIAAYGADPNGWAPASWRTHPTYDTPGSDSIYRARTTGYRRSFMNTADTVQNSMQFRLRTYNGVDDGGTLLVPTVPNPIPASGDSFLFVQGTRYLINVVRAGTVETGTKTDPAGGKQVWTFDDAALGDAGKGVGGWCGFQAALGRHMRIEPVPGVPFCQSYDGGGGGGGDPGDPVSPWWKIPGGNRSGKLWNRGPGLTFATSAWTPKMGAYDVTTGASHRTAGTMNEIIGGPVSGTLSSYDNVANIQNGSQLDWAGTTMDSAANTAVRGKTWLIWVPDTNPTGGPYDTGGHNPSTTVWSTWASPGVHDDWWYAMGRRARAVMLSYGLEPWQLMLRINHEMNQSNNYQMYYGCGPDYAKAMGRFMTGFRAGYTAHSADDYPRMIFSPSRHLDCGPLERFFTCDPVALTTPYDLVDVSAHPSGTMNKYATGYTFDQQVAQVKTWIAAATTATRGPPTTFPRASPGPLRAELQRVDHSMIKLAKKYSIGMCNSEWSPRYDQATCTISAAVYQAMHDWFTANAALVRLRVRVPQQHAEQERGGGELGRRGGQVHRAVDRRPGRDPQGGGFLQPRLGPHRQADVGLTWAQLTTTTLDFGEWAPDSAPLTGGATLLQGVLPAPDGYAPLPLPVVQGPAGLPDASLLIAATTPTASRCRWRSPGAASTAPRRRPGCRSAAPPATPPACRGRR